MTDGPILVLGASGKTGRRVAAALAAAGRDVRAASRSGPVRFDWEDRATWEPAVDGAAGAYVMAPDGTPVDPAFVELAVARGVRRLVLLSSAGIEEMGDQRLLDAERTVKGAGADWTILRPSWFDQNFDEGFLQPAVLAGEVAVPVGDQRFAFVDADDIAASAAAALTGDGHAGRTYALTGPDALTFAEAVAIVGEAAGRALRFDGTRAAYVAALVGAGAPREEAEGAAAAFEGLAAAGDEEVTSAVQDLTGRPPTPFTAYAAAAAAAGAWDG